MSRFGPVSSRPMYIETNTACVHGSTNGTNGIPISSKVIPMVPLVIPLVPKVMPMVPFALRMVLLVPLVSQWCHWLPMVPLVKLPMVPLGEPRTEQRYDRYVYARTDGRVLGLVKVF